MAGDDRAVQPHKGSQAAVRALRAATEHLDALRALLMQAKIMHPTAPYTLIRAAIETGATAVWLLAPASRTERVMRSLQHSVRDAIDGTTVAEEIGTPPPRPLEQRRADIDRIAQAARGGPLIRIGPPRSSTEIVRCADEVLGAGIGVLTAWRVCSGFAHGRLWATLGVLEKEFVELDVPDEIGLRVTNSVQSLTWATMAAVAVINHGMHLYRVRSTGPYP